VRYLSRKYSMCTLVSLHSCQRFCALALTPFRLHTLVFARISEVHVFDERSITSPVEFMCPIQPFLYAWKTNVTFGLSKFVCLIAGLVVPFTGCKLTVGGKSCMWRNGCCILIDDSFNHSVSHDGAVTDGPRVVLVVDLWHPDMTVKERMAVNALFPSS
jgi:Aspartyl/Asparaginyl beta-hydroxylase